MAATTTPNLALSRGLGKRTRSGRASHWLAVLRSPTGATAGVLLLAVLVLAIVAPLLWSGQANAIDTNHILQGPTAAHLIGTDNLGRDLFFRVLVASGLSVGLALLATMVAVIPGLILGAAPVLLGSRVGRIVTAGVNIGVAFPGLLLALFFAVIFGIGAVGAVLAIGASGIPAFARLTQTLVAGVADRDYISAARISGVGRMRILTRHVLPNIGEPLVVNATIGAGGALLAFSGLSFLGLGVQAPSYDWGQLLGTGLNMIYENPAAALAPGVAVVVAGLAFSMFGEAVAKGIGTATLGGTFSRSHRRAIAPDSPASARDGGELHTETVLEVHNLSVSFPGASASSGRVQAVRGISISLRRGEAVGVVGESGSGKSVTALAIARLIEEPGRVDADHFAFLGTDLLTGTEREHRGLLGTSLAMVFQDPMTSFNPTKRVGPQLAEVAQQHQGMDRRAALARAVDRLRAVRMPDPELRVQQYPHEFSGGMRQRAMIGMGLMSTPALIIADEPTTALDPTVQKQILQLLHVIRTEDNVAILLISHDVSVVAELCERVIVMYAGQIVEDLPASELHSAARHPYTRALIAAVPTMRTDVDRPLSAIPGRPVDPTRIPVGCPYAARCPLADERCRAEDPPLASDSEGRRVACWHAGEPIPADAVIDRARPVAETVEAQ